MLLTILITAAIAQNPVHPWEQRLQAVEAQNKQDAGRIKGLEDWTKIAANEYQSAAEAFDLRLKAIEVISKGIPNAQNDIRDKLLDGDARLKEVEKVVSQLAELRKGLESMDARKAEVDPGLLRRVADLEKVIADLQVVHTEKTDTQLSKQDDQLSKMDEIINKIGSVAGVVVSNPSTPDLLRVLTDPHFDVNAVMTVLLGWMGWLAHKRNKIAAVAAESSEKTAAATQTTAAATVATAEKVGVPVSSIAGAGNLPLKPPGS